MNYGNLKKIGTYFYNSGLSMKTKYANKTAFSKHAFTWWEFIQKQKSSKKIKFSITY